MVPLLLCSPRGHHISCTPPLTLTPENVLTIGIARRMNVKGILIIRFSVVAAGEKTVKPFWMRNQLKSWFQGSSLGFNLLWGKFRMQPRRLATSTFLEKIRCIPIKRKSF